MSSISLSQFPGLASSDVHSFVEGLISAALKGVKVYLTATAYSRLKPYFDELGIRVKEASGNTSDSQYILIKVEGFRLTVELHDGSTVETRSFKIGAFINALKQYAERRRGAKEPARLYELIISEELKEKLEKIMGEADER